MDLQTALDVTRKRDAHGNPVPFDIEFVSLDRNRNRPSQHKKLKQVVRGGAAHDLIRAGQIAVKPADGSGHNTPVHVRLIMRINGELVV